MALNEVSRAAALLESIGLGDLSDPGVIAQLAAKHPARAGLIPISLLSREEDWGPPPEVNMHEVLRGLRRHVAPGLSGMRNEFLRVLVGTYAPPSGGATVDLLQGFAERLVSDSLPEWFMWAWSSCSLVAPIKTAAAVAGGTPDVRPVAVGEALRRAIARSVLRAAGPVYAEVLQPHQLLVGVRMGDSKLVHGVRLLLEHRPTYAALHIDLRNAYNLVRRSAVLARHAAQPKLRHLVPWLRSELGPCSILRAGDTWLDSDEGVQQGWPLSSAAFCVAIQPEVMALDAELSAHGGCARFGADDGILVGPPEVVWRAFAKFVADLEEATGCVCQLPKCVGYSPAGPEAFVGAPAGIRRGQVGAHYGIDVFGVPLGDPGYVAAAMRKRGEEVDGIHRLYVTKLHLRPALLWCMLQHSLQHRPMFFLRNMPPRQVDVYCRTVDAAMHRSAEAALALALPRDSLAGRRLYLPARERGGGLRSAASIAAAAYLSAFGEVLPTFVDHRNPEGDFVPGVYHSQLGAIIGQASFAPGGTRFVTFLATCLPSALALQSSHLELHLGTQELGGAHLIDGPLSALDPDGCRQKAISALLDAVRVRRLNAAFLLASPRESVLWRQLDAFSSAWVTAIPSEGLGCTTAQFREIAAAYFFQRSPALVGRAGSRILLAGEARQAVVCDPFGDALTCASIPGFEGGWVQQHNVCKMAVYEAAVFAGVPANVEVEGLFRHLLPLCADGRDRLRGVVPDVMALLPQPASPELPEGEGVTQRHLAEVKTLHYSPRLYPLGLQQRAVDARAALVSSQLATSLHRLDCVVHGVAEGSLGPLQQYATSFPYHALVFGHVGEASKGVSAFLRLLAHQGADAYGREVGALTAEAASAALYRVLQSRVAMAAWRARADVLLQRLHFVACPGPRVARAFVSQPHRRRWQRG